MVNSCSDTDTLKKLTSALRLVRTDGIGAIRYHQLIKKFGTAEAALEALPTLPKNKKTSAVYTPPSLATITKEIEDTFNYGGEFILHRSDEYPELLGLLDDAPPVLTILGDASLLHRQNVAIVGARNASMHGIRIAESLAADLAAHSIGTTSGLARGIDQAAHTGALYTGFTIAAIGCGIDVFYPAEHQKLQEEIAQKGVIVTEFPIGTAPQATHFPRRNRLIAGLCHGCVIIEAALNSGSLITSKLALNYNKPIFSVPGSPLDPRCKGSNHLLRMGAILTESAYDIIPELISMEAKTQPYAKRDLFSDIEHFDDKPATKYSESPEVIDDASIEAQILATLSTLPTSLDIIMRKIPRSSTEILSTITLLEINNKIIFQHNGYIIAP